MTFLEKYNNARSKLQDAMEDIGILQGNILRNRNSLPDNLSSGFSAGVYCIEKEEGIYKTKRQYTCNKLTFGIYLIVDADKDISSPDDDLYSLVLAFRNEYKVSFNDDFKDIEFYDSYVKATHPVRIAKMLVVL